MEHWFSPSMMEDSDQIQVVGLGTKCLYLLSPHIILLSLRFNFLFNYVLVLWGGYIHLNNIAYGGQQRKSDHLELGYVDAGNRGAVL